MDVLVNAIVMAVFLAASPVGAWYTNRHPAVRNETWGGALGLTLSWLGFLLAMLFCAWQARRKGMTASDLGSLVGPGDLD
jgi:hypothetical protein